jgi:hypothetical protein
MFERTTGPSASSALLSKTGSCLTPKVVPCAGPLVAVSEHCTHAHSLTHLCCIPKFCGLQPCDRTWTKHIRCVQRPQRYARDCICASNSRRRGPLPPCSHFRTRAQSNQRSTPLVAALHVTARFRPHMSPLVAAPPRRPVSCAMAARFRSWVLPASQSIPFLR